MKLNLGCGQNRIAGYVNVDREAAVAPDLVMDLEQFPWPFESDSVDEVVANHVLEHVGATPAMFMRIMQELYRVCRSGARVDIAVPHPRNDSFLDDPTHVRAITPGTMQLFSRSACEDWKRRGCANSPLALYAGVDFEIRDVLVVPEEKFRDAPDFDDLVERCNNVAAEYRMVLEVIK